MKDLEDKISVLVKYWNRNNKIFQPDSLSMDEVFIKKIDFDKWIKL